MRRLLRALTAPLRAVQLLLAICALFMAGSCTAADRWTGEDKVQHAVYSCAASVFAYALVGADRPWLAFALGLVPGVRKEWYDQKHKAAQGNGWSWKDMAANAAGAGSCVGAMRWTITHSNGTSTVAFSTPF